MKAHPTAVIHPATRLDPTVTVGPYAVIEDGVEIGPHCVIASHAIIRSGSILGERCQVDSHAVIGGLPQDLSFHPSTPSGVRIGNRVTIRESVTIHRATKEGSFTQIGDHCYLMACAHIGHDSVVGNHVTIANAALLAGHVSIGSHSFVGGGAAFHQHIRVGESAMVGGLAGISLDLPPFCLMAERNRLVGLNMVGLQRRGFDREVIRSLKNAFQLVFAWEGNPRRLAQAALADNLTQTSQDTQFLEFIAADSKKGIMRKLRSSTSE